MHPWFSWIRWLNPIYYGFEILIANEFHGREFTCSQFFPPYSPFVGDSFICASTGAVTGRTTVSGDAYMEMTYSYSYSHVWRNFGILIGFLIGFMIIYFAAVELNSSVTSTAEALVFPRGNVPAHLDPKKKRKSKDEEGTSDTAAVVGKVDHDGQDPQNTHIEPQRDLFTWKDVVYDIHIKKEKRRLLDHVTGWVKPGTLTALMGASGAGKTTLLDVLAQRTTVGVVTGDMFVNGRPFGADFQRQTGYVQQQGKKPFLLFFPTGVPTPQILPFSHFFHPATILHRFCFPPCLSSRKLLTLSQIFTSTRPPSENPSASAPCCAAPSRSAKRKSSSSSRRSSRCSAWKSTPTPLSACPARA